MTHISKEKSKLLSRLSRIRGQLDAVQRALDEGGSCTTVLQQATACRGALDGFIAEIIEDHIREHLVGPQRATARGRAAEELIEIVHSYLT
jgi:DNA-binding FrmR family transcriptional regulator